MKSLERPFTRPLIVSARMSESPVACCSAASQSSMAACNTPLLRSAECRACAASCLQSVRHLINVDLSPKLTSNKSLDPP